MPTVTPRILTLHIDHVAPGRYRTEVSEHGASVTKECMFSSISEAIREEALSVPEGFAHFMEVRYCGLSSGTIALSALPDQSNAVAEHLIALLHEMHLIAESQSAGK